jgi:hypothetical protein
MEEDGMEEEMVFDGEKKVTNAHQWKRIEHMYG